MNASQMRDTLGWVTSYIIANQVERMTWQKSVALSGLIVWGEQRGLDAAKHWLDRAVATQNSRGMLNYADKEFYPHGHQDSSITDSGTLALTLVYPMLRLQALMPQPGYMEAARLQVAAAMAAPRTRDGGFWSRLEAPELWVDFMYLSFCPLALYGKTAGDAAVVDEAFRQFEVHADHLVDPRMKLARHVWRETPDSYPESTFWSRGNGWLITCGVDLLAMFDAHPRREAVARTTVDVLNAMGARQDRSGFLHDILDDPTSRMEASGTLMYAYSVARAVRLGLLPKERLEGAVRAFKVVAGSVREDGAVPGVSIPPGGPTAPLGSAMYGQGFYLMAAHEMREQLF